jgi:hypothetical protein
MLKQTPRFLLVLLTLALGAPAFGGSVFRWTGPDGSLSFTDDADRVPARYRSQAVQVRERDVTGYARYTPTDAAAQDSYQARLFARLERLREANASAAEARVGAAFAPIGQAVSETLVRVNDDTAIRVPNQVTDQGPVVVEEVRVRRPGSNFTIHDTVVRQGDQVLMVVRPAQPHQAGPGDVVDEADLFD